MSVHLCWGGWGVAKYVCLSLCRQRITQTASSFSAGGANSFKEVDDDFRVSSLWRKHLTVPVQKNISGATNPEQNTE